MSPLAQRWEWKHKLSGGKRCIGVTSHAEVGMETYIDLFCHCLPQFVTSRAEVGMETVSSSFPLICFLSHLSRRGVNGNPMSSGFRGIKQCHLSCRGVNRNSCVSGSVAFSIRHLSRRGVNRNKPVLVSNIVTYVTSRAEVGIETNVHTHEMLCYSIVTSHEEV